jgi:hypothetical protein
MEKGLVKNLTDFGLSVNQAKVYLSIIHLGPATVNSISKDTGLHQQDIYKIYGQLCDYTHPNFMGWQEIMGVQGANEVLLELPTFVGVNTDNSLKVMLYLMQYTFKTFVETFKPYLKDHAAKLSTWQESYSRIIPK